MRETFKEHDPITVKGYTYGFLRFRAYMPKNHGGLKFKTCEVYHSSNNDFRFCYVKTVRLSDVKLIK